MSLSIWQNYCPQYPSFASCLQEQYPIAWWLKFGLCIRNVPFHRLYWACGISKLLRQTAFLLNEKHSIIYCLAIQKIIQTVNPGLALGYFFGLVHFWFIKFPYNPIHLLYMVCYGIFWSGQFLRIKGFHMTSRRPYWCSNTILWELNTNFSYVKNFFYFNKFA